MEISSCRFHAHKRKVQIHSHDIPTDPFNSFSNRKNIFFTNIAVQKLSRLLNVSVGTLVIVRLIPAELRLG